MAGTSQMSILQPRKPIGRTDSPSSRPFVDRQMFVGPCQRSSVIHNELLALLFLRFPISCVASLLHWDWPSQALQNFFKILIRLDLLVSPCNCILLVANDKRRVYRSQTTWHGRNKFDVCRSFMKFAWVWYGWRRILRHLIFRRVQQVSNISMVSTCT